MQAVTEHKRSALLIQLPHLCDLQNKCRDTCPGFKISGDPWLQDAVWFWIMLASFKIILTHPILMGLIPFYYLLQGQIYKKSI